MNVLLVSSYELGRPPTGIASPLAWLKDAGFDPEVLDLAVGRFDEDKARRARLAAFSVPMHTALSLAVRAAGRLRELNPSCHVNFHGLYAHLNARHLLGSVADSVLGGECEQALAELALALRDGAAPRLPGAPVLRRPAYKVPERAALAPLSRYAKLLHRGEERLAAYVEASRGCKHVCRHCPITPVYGGRFFAVPEEVALEDASRQIAAGASHVSFGDPDFLNGPAHALRVARGLARRHPGVTFDFTAKVEHLLKHRGLLREFKELGCLFVTSAVESLSDEVLARLEKGHTREDAFRALEALRGAGLDPRLSLVSFTPWTRREDFAEVLGWVGREGLAYNVDPVHYAIRLLVPPGSPLSHLGPLDPASFSHVWAHPDPAMDRLQKDVMAAVMAAAESREDEARTLARVMELAGAPGPVRVPAERPPRLSESWFCCAEPTEAQFGSVV